MLHNERGEQMRKWTCRRLADEAGISLVEMMVALMIFTVAAFALLGGLIASAQSVLDQQLRADATRVATQQLESARTADFDTLAIGTDNQTVTTGNGRQMTVERTVEWIDAFDPDAGTNQDVKQVTVTVGWSDRGEDREVVYTTALSPPDPAVVGSNTVVATVLPGAVPVGDDGVPLLPVTLEASPDGFSYVGNMSGRWTRQDGTLASVQLAQVPATQTWSAVLPPEDLAYTMDPGDSVELTLTVVAGAYQGTAVLTLHRPLETDPDPALSNADVSVDPIYLTNPAGGSTNCGVNRCKNVDPVTFTVMVTPFSPAQQIERVYVEYDLRDATSPTEHDLTVGADGLTWSATAAADTVQFAPGSAQPFSFVAVFDGGQLTAPLNVAREVTHP